MNTTENKYARPWDERIYLLGIMRVMQDLMFEQTVDYGDNVAFHPDSQDPQKRLQPFNITNYSILIIKSIYY